MNAWRELRAFVLTAFGLTLAFSVTQGWGWPLLSDARAGIIVLGVVGMAVCGTSSWAVQKVSWTNPFLLVATVAGIVLLGAGVIGLFANRMEYLVVMMVATVVIWLVATVRHLVEATPGQRPAPAA
jgi:hypothetical protein